MADLRNEDTLREVIQRATEIEAQTRLLAASDDEINEFIRASEEAGISRDATLQALRERLDVRPEALKEGQLVFALSQDERHHPARVLEVDTDSALVRFLNGGEARVRRNEVKSFSLTPGQKMEFNSPSWSMWVTGEVVRVNMDAGSLTYSCWGVEESVPLDRVRSLKPGTKLDARDRAALIGYSVVSFLAGGIGGIILMKLLNR